MTMMDQFTWIQPFMFSFCYFSSVRSDLFPVLIMFWVVGHGGPDPRFPFATHCLFSRHRSTSDAGMIYWADDGWNRCNTWLGQPNPSLKISDHRSVRDLMQLESYSRTWNKIHGQGVAIWSCESLESQCIHSVLIWVFLRKWDTPRHPKTIGFPIPSLGPHVMKSLRQPRCCSEHRAFPWNPVIQYP